MARLTDMSRLDIVEVDFLSFLIALLLWFNMRTMQIFSASSARSVHELQIEDEIGYY